MTIEWTLTFFSNRKPRIIHFINNKKFFRVLTIKIILIMRLCKNIIFLNIVFHPDMDDEIN